MTVEFGDLPDGPPKTGAPGIWGVIGDQLRARPGEWAKVRTEVSHVRAVWSASNVRNGKYQRMLPGEFEATARDCDVWARYVGGES